MILDKRFVLEDLLKSFIETKFLFFCRYVLGHEAMKKMGASNVLIVGMNGLGVEIGILKTLN